MDLVFFGSGAFGLPTLEALATSPRHSLRGVVSQPDRPAGRGGALTPTPIAAWVAGHRPDIPILKPPSVNDPAVVAEIRGLASAFVVIAFGQKLGPALLADRFAINLHASLLPRWRGAAPINAAVLAGDTVTGNSVITLADRMDAGRILAQSTRPIYPDMTAGELHDLLARDGPDLILSVLAEHESGTGAEREQDPAGVTLAPKLSKADAWADFTQPAAAVRNRIHGLTPWPGVAARLGDLSLKLCRAQPAGGGSESGEPGTIVDPAAGLVACGGGTLLRLLEVHPAGKRRMSWPDFVHGHRVSPGDRLTSTPP